ncbi:MAG: hypothetical protein ACODAE_01905 [Gemmatimonadota bacterium]
MNRERWRSVQEIFLEARDLEGTERERFLADACGDDAALLDEVRSLLAADADEGILDGAPLLDIAIATTEGEIAAAAGDYDTALRHLLRGVESEDGLTYDEPPPWGLPVRQQLGAVLLAADRPAEAEAAYRRDLDRHPENGWSLHGLEVALRRQGRNAEADEVAARFAEAWASADVHVVLGVAASTRVAGRAVGAPAAG